VAANRSGRLRRPSAGPHDHGPGLELTGLETDRLRLAPVPPLDLPKVLAVFKSNPHYLSWTEEGEYDLDALRADWDAANETEGRHMLALRDRATGEIVGVIEYLENNASDGHPWIGLIIVTADRQREGLAAEAVEAVSEHVHRNWAQPIRMAVIDENRAGLALAISLGFTPYGEAPQLLGGKEQRLVLLQRRM
jgi:RimJ/RimL family protein N-acetyltransferase